MSYSQLNVSAVETQLEAILTRWQPAEDEAAAFRGWAYVVAAVSDSCATEEPQTCFDLLQREHQSLHSSIATGLLERASVNLELVSKRAFLTFLTQALTPVPRQLAA